MDLLPSPGGDPKVLCPALFCPRKAVTLYCRWLESMATLSKKLLPGYLLSVHSCVPCYSVAAQWCLVGLLFLVRQYTFFKMYFRKGSILSQCTPGDPHTMTSCTNPMHCSLSHSFPFSLTCLQEMGFLPSGTPWLFSP